LVTLWQTLRNLEDMRLVFSNIPLPMLPREYNSEQSEEEKQDKSC